MPREIRVTMTCGNCGLPGPVRGEEREFAKKIMVDNWHRPWADLQAAIEQALADAMERGYRGGYEDGEYYAQGKLYGEDAEGGTDCATVVD